MLRRLRIRLNPETVSWAVAFGLFEVGMAAGLRYFGVGPGLTLAWTLVAGAIFASCEPGLFAWLWVVIAGPDEEPSAPKKRAPVRAAEHAPESSTSPKDEGQQNQPTQPSASAEQRLPNPKRVYEEKVTELIGKRSSNMARMIEVLFSLALAFLTYFGSHWAPGRVPPPDQAALQHSVDQLRDDLRNCARALCATDRTNNDFSHLDPRFRQEILDAVKAAANTSNTWWTGPTIFGVSAIVVLIIALAVALVLMVRRRPETAAPLGALGLAATAVKEAEHLSRLDTLSYRIAEGAFLLLLGAFVWLAWEKIRNPEPPAPPPAQPGGEQGKSKVESPLSLLFSSLVLLWALLAICYRYQSATPEPQPHPTPAPPQSVSLDFRWLPSITGFVPGKPDQLASQSSMDEVVRQIMQQARDKDAKPGDMLLLLGSADCTAVRKPNELSNNTLARQRAERVAGIVQNLNVFSADHVVARSMYQTERCIGSADLRAVFPVLIKVQTAAATVQ